MIFQGKKLNDFFIRRKNYEKHMDKLKQISNKKARTTVQDNCLTNTLNDFKEKNRKFTTYQRNRQILQQNSKVFDKLVDISSRIPKHLIDLKQYRKKEHHNSYFNQKQSFKIINEQNPNIVRRIMYQNSPLNKDKQLEQYQQKRKFKQRIQKFPYFKSIQRKLRNANTNSQYIVRKKKISRYYTQQLSNRINQSSTN